MKKPPFSGMSNTSAQNPFTLDNTSGEPVEMPSVTKLLNRKKLGLSDSSSTKTSLKLKAPPKKPAVPTTTPGQPEIMRVQPRKTRPKTQKIAQWTREDLAKATDTFQKAVHYLIQKGAQQALLLAPQDGPVSHAQANIRFDALCAYMSEDKAELWSGLSLSPSLIPDIWRRLFSHGIYEIIPSVSLSTQDESASFLIKAFGLKPTDFFVIIRCGSPNACTGILALVSPFSLSKEIASAFSAPKASGRAA